MAIKRKPVIRGHECTQEDNINHLIDSNNKLSVIITGNGNPEKGLCRQVAIIGERQAVTLEKLTAITDSLTDFHKKYEETHSVIEQIKFESEIYNKEKKEKEQREDIAVDLSLTKRRDKWQRRVWIVMAVIGILSIWISVYSSIINGKKINKQNTEKVESVK
jgi:hypothetical protein